ncbi:restriction endonuclease [Shinella sp. CPCC 100929]|uniref:Restriction endonuclease n=1 Tax=Shinella lacus TaxID=2654216 RepID=A0ABT1RE29_9HYPH|nr:restriction endonuclease [Shinella lacus]
MDPLGRLCTVSPEEFERFVLECADGYLAQKVPRVSEIQQRGGAGDKGRDIVVRLGELGSADRCWNLYQYKRYSGALGDICKVLYFDSIGISPCRTNIGSSLAGELLEVFTICATIY